jgi:SOS-response transcriptional repressor LexA
MSVALDDGPAMTARESAALRFIAGYVEAHGYAPSIRAIAKGIGRGSTGTTHSNLESLADLGHIRRLSYRACAIEVVTKLPVPRAPDGAACHFIPAQIVARRLERLHPRGAA